MKLLLAFLAGAAARCFWPLFRKAPMKVEPEWLSYKPSFYEKFSRLFRKNHELHTKALAWLKEDGNSDVPTLRQSLKDAWTAWWKYHERPCCARCGTLRGGLRLECSRTSYSYNGPDGPNNPNRPDLLCRSCAQEHHDYWNDMWRDYYSGRL